MHHDGLKINISNNCSWVSKCDRKHIKKINFPKITSFKKDIINKFINKKIDLF